MATMLLPEIGTFCAVAELGSFTQAAKRLGFDKSKVSRDVRLLEERLGTALMVRSTRSIRLTAEGQTLFERASPHLDALRQALSSLPHDERTPSGEVTLSTTPELGRALLAPLLVGLRARYPNLRVRVLLDHTLVDLLGEGVDLALRVGRPGSSGLIARKVSVLGSGFYAAPAYLRRRGTPQRVEQLGDHDGLWPKLPRGQVGFAPGIEPTPAVVECVDFDMLRELAVRGGGVAMLPEFLARTDVETGSLVRVLPQLTLAKASLYLVSRPMRPLPARLNVLRRFLLNELPKVAGGS